MVAHAKSNWQETIAQLQPVLPRLWAIGGSHAQHNLFEQVCLNAMRHQGQHQEANLLRQRQLHPTIRSDNKVALPQNSIQIQAVRILFQNC
jgi:hypothetical protein